MPLPAIDPPLLNSSNPWATTTTDLQRLFDSEHTGAVTTRTSLLNGFEHDNVIHQHTFFDPLTGSVKPEATVDGQVPAKYGGSLNTLGYSPILLSTYLTMVAKVANDSPLTDHLRASKVFIISVTGSAQAVRDCYQEIQQAQSTLENPLCIKNQFVVPKHSRQASACASKRWAYSGESLAEYLDVLSQVETPKGQRRVPIGVKTPPYTYHDQFRILIDALLAASKPECLVEFITATNTLGSSLVLSNKDAAPALSSASGAGIGGMAGAPLHPLALGNVKTIRNMLDEHESLKSIDLIGVGGVGDHEAFLIMRSVGAKVVAVGTALGREGVEVFRATRG